MSEQRLSENLDDEDVSVPQTIDDEFFKTVQLRTETLIKDLREKEQYQLARELIRLFTIAENLQLNFKDEQAKVRQLKEQHVDATGRIEDAVKISQKDRDTISKLRLEVVGAWKRTDASKTREVEMSDRLDLITAKFGNAQNELKKFATRIEESDGSPLGQHKVTVLQECERLSSEINDLNKRLQVQRAYSEEVQHKLDDSLETNRNLFQQWDEASNESLSNKKRVELLTAKVETMIQQLDKMNESMLHFKTQSEVRHNKIVERDRRLSVLQNDLEKVKNNYAALGAVKTKLDASFKACTTELSELKHEMDQLKNFMRLKEDENRKLIIENERQLKKLGGFTRKFAAIEKIVSKNEQDILTQKNVIVTVEKERDSIRRTNDSMKKENDQLNKKIEGLMHELEKRDALTVELRKEKLELEAKQVLSENDLKLSAAREKKSSQNVKNLHSKLESVESEKSYLEESLNELNAELEEKTQLVETIKMEMNEVNNQLAVINHQYNLSVKQLKDARSDFQKCHEKEADIKDRMEKCKSQIDDTNVRLAGKIAEIGDLHKTIKKSEKKNRELNRDMEQCEEALKFTRNEVKTIRLENKTQKDALRENDARFVRMKNQMDKILRERDLIANQMLRRTDENELLEREVSVLKTTIECGNGKYNERIDDIKIMTNEIKSLRSQSNVLKRGLENTADMRHEVHQLHRKLNQERTKTKVLEQEMITPMNVHRWRKLSRFDPKHMEMLRKCQRLQRNVLNQSNKITKSEEVIQALNAKLNLMELELNRRPCASVHEKLLLTRAKLNANTKQMKAAIAISRATIGDVKTKDQTITQLNTDLKDVKCQLYKEKLNKSKLMGKFHELKKTEESEEVEAQMKNLGKNIKSKFTI